LSEQCKGQNHQESYPNVKLSREPAFGNTEGVQQCAQNVEEACKMYFAIVLPLF